MGVDRFGNPHASDLTYARGKILRSTEDDFQKLQVAWSLIRERGPDSISIFTGFEQYDPARVRALIATTKQIAGEPRPLLGNRLRETPTTVQIEADDILEIAIETRRRQPEEVRALLLGKS